MKERLKQINGKDNDEIIDLINGDMRKAILLLQYSNENNIEHMCCVSNKLCDKLLNDLQTKSLKEILDTCFEIDKGAYDISKMLELLGKKILELKNIPHKNEILFLLSEKDANIQNGLWDYIELVEFCSKIEFLIKQK